MWAPLTSTGGIPGASASPQCWRWHLRDRAQLTRELGARSPQLGGVGRGRSPSWPRAAPGLTLFALLLVSQDEQLLLQPLLLQLLLPLLLPLPLLLQLLLPLGCQHLLLLLQGHRGSEAG